MDLSFEPGQVQTSVLFKLVKNDKISQNILNSGLKKISKRAIQWKMPFNPDDTKQAAQVYFSRKQNENSPLQLKFNNKTVPMVEKHFIT